MREFAVVDLETTGFGKNDRVVEIGIVIVKGNTIIQEWDTLINPERDISNSFIHGITAELVSLAPTFEEIADCLSEFLHGRIFVAHNIPFDSRMLLYEFARANRLIHFGQGFCTLKATGAKLGVACDEYDIDIQSAHSAVHDARATAQLLTKVFHDRNPLKEIHVESFHRNVKPRVLSRALAQPQSTLQRAPIRRIVRNTPVEQRDGIHLSYLDALHSVMADMRLTQDEHRHLNELASDLGLTPKQQLEAHTVFFNAVVAAAQRDSFMSPAEKSLIDGMARELGVSLERPIEHSVSSVPSALAPGTRICFTGEAHDACGEAIPREHLHARASAAGLTPVDSVTKKACDLLVAADTSSMSGKTKKARDYGISVISVEDFLRLINHQED